MPRTLRDAPPVVWLLAVAALMATQGLVLYAYGQPPICTCGTVRLWAGQVLGPENSQQITDWYSFSHVIHGIGFYFLLWLIAPRAPVLLRLALAVGLEVGWEVLENTPFIIERYRQQALAQGYVGDSILNSLSDTCLRHHRLLAGAAVAGARQHRAGGGAGSVRRRHDPRQPDPQHHPAHSSGAGDLGLAGGRVRAAA